METLIAIKLLIPVSNQSSVSGLIECSRIATRLSAGDNVNRLLNTSRSLYQIVRFRHINGQFQCLRDAITSTEKMDYVT